MKGWGVRIPVGWRQREQQLLTVTRGAPQVVTRLDHGNNDDVGQPSSICWVIRPQCHAIPLLKHAATSFQPHGQVRPKGSRGWCVLPYRTMCKQCPRSGMQPTLDLFHTYAKVSNRYVKRMVLTCWRRRKERLTLHAAQPTGLVFVVMVTGLHFKDVGHVINSHWLSNSDDCFSTFFHNFYIITLLLCINASIVSCRSRRI